MTYKRRSETDPFGLGHQGGFSGLPYPLHLSSVILFNILDMFSCRPVNSLHVRVACPSPS
jgi:hypothetical protein